jgi:hypothetical protein
VKKQSIALATALALCCSLICSPARAKTFVGVLWPMFGPFLAVGLVELVAEIKLMPDVEVKTYLHQNWPALVEDLNRQPKGTRTLVVGYSLGANSTVFVANKVDYIDSIIALQPSMLSWNPDLTGKVGRIIEIYNPKPAMTFGGMGSKKLVGENENIEYIANNDGHIGTQFSATFRNLVKSEIARLSAEDELAATPAEPSQPSGSASQIAEPVSANIPGKLASDPPALDSPASGSQNDVQALDSDKTRAQPHCATAASAPADGAEPSHYGSLMWQAAAMQEKVQEKVQEKKPDAPAQDIAGNTPCSD